MVYLKWRLQNVHCGEELVVAGKRILMLVGDYVEDCEVMGARIQL